MKKGDWVCDGANIGTLRGKPYEVYPGSGLLIDVVIYDLGGKRIGRVSPCMGNFKSFDPCLPAEDWKLIEQPHFPLSKFADLDDVVQYL